MSQSDKDSKTEKLRAAVKRRVNKEEYAFRLVEKMVLLDSVDKELLLNAGTHITVSQYKDVTEDRAITKLCGYPLCNNRITQVLRQRYKISVRENKVYDITERKNFCSNKCYKASKYFQSQLSAEPIWMKEETNSIELKLLDDGEELAKKFSGSGEEVFISKFRDDEKHEHVHHEREHDHNERERVDDEHEHDHDEHERVDDEHEHDPNEHERVDDEHEHVHNEREHLGGEYGHVDDDHERDNVHKHIDNNADLSCIIGSMGNVQIDLDLTDSDDDDNNDGIDDIDNDNEVKIENNQKHTQNSESNVGYTFENAKMFIKDLKSSNEYFVSATELKNRATNLPGLDNPNQSSHKTTDLPKKEIGTNFSKTLKPSYNNCKSREIHGSNSDGSLVRSSDNPQSSEEELARKQGVDKVYQVFLEWCGSETKECIRTFLRKKENESWDERRKVEECGVDTKSVTLPSIDSKSQMVIRGKIVSEKLTIAMAPMLSELSLAMADISFQLTYLLKTFRFTNTNIVLKPAEWKLASLILLLVLIKYSPSLSGMLSSRQKDLHRLLSNTVDDEEDIDRLLGVFNFEDISESKSAMIADQQQFDMEELD